MALSTVRIPDAPTSDLRTPTHGFGLTPELVQTIFRNAKPLGHDEDADQLNLGFGFLYYALARMLRPQHVVVIGSGFGFSVVCFALGQKDNGSGILTFVDPSYSVLADGPFQTVGGSAQWSDPDKVQRHFARFGVESIVTHHRLRSQEFFERYDALGLPPIDVAFIDGNHAYEAVRHDFVGAVRHSRKNGYVLLHDTNIYVRELVRHAGVKRWLKRIASEKDAFEFVDFPFSSGVAIVRVLEPKIWKEFNSPLPPDSSS
jgi:predicted O-methyltransferase YrrM